MADKGDDINNCPVCLDVYEENGDHVPRILPCGFTLCDKCIGRLLQGKSLDCPECRIRHDVVNGTRSFPRNKYILRNMQGCYVRGKPSETQYELKTVERFDECRIHRKEMNIYCKDTRCQKIICESCMIKHHVGHAVVNIKEEHKEKAEILFTKLESVTKDLHTKKTKILNAKEIIERNSETCVVKLKTRKEELIKMISRRYDNLMKDALVQKTKENIDDEVAIIEENLALLNSIRDNCANTAMTLEEIRSQLDTLMGVAEGITYNLSGTRSFKYLEYNENQAATKDVERMCGYLTKKETNVKLSEPNNELEVTGIIYRPSTKQRISEDEGVQYRPIVTAPLATSERTRHVADVTRSVPTVPVSTTLLPTTPMVEKRSYKDNMAQYTPKPTAQVSTTPTTGQTRYAAQITRPINTIAPTGQMRPYAKHS